MDFVSAVLTAALVFVASRLGVADSTFVIENNQFVLDGHPIQLFSGAMHYFRVPKSQWRDRMLRMKALGLNTLETYVAWNVHNPYEDVYDFEGQNDVESYLRLAQELDFHLIIRPGPYICGEWDFGALPAWLLNPKKKLNGPEHLRTYYPAFIDEVDKWFSVILPKLAPFMRENGGRALLVQVENEYSAYGDASKNPNDKKYLEHLVALSRKYLGNEVVLFTTDMKTRDLYLKGSLQDGSVFTVADFGPTADVETVFRVMREFNPPGRSPNFNSEFYPGWLVHWGERHANTSAQDVAATMKSMLAVNASFNFYMIHGGTNFGFMSGANVAGETYQPDITSYDYNAPIGEDGRHGFHKGVDKYLTIRSIFQNHYGDSFKIPEEPPFEEAAVYPSFRITEAASFRESFATLAMKSFTNQKNVQRMEAYDQSHGFIHYSRRVDPAVCMWKRYCKLHIDGVRDRVTVFVDGQIKGILYRNDPRQDLRFTVTSSELFTLDLLVENMGRINFDRKMYDPKGIIGKGVYMNDQLMTNDWTVNTLPLETQQLSKLQFTSISGAPIKEPTFFHGQFSIEAPQTVRNTFLKMDGWEKGVVWVNGHNVGRYWQSQRTQQALFVPLDFLRRGVNDVVVLELDKSPSDVSTFQLSFSDHPIFWQ